MYVRSYVTCTLSYLYLTRVRGSIQVRSRPSKCQSYRSKAAKGKSGTGTGGICSRFSIFKLVVAVDRPPHGTHTFADLLLKMTSRRASESTPLLTVNPCLALDPGFVRDGGSMSTVVPNKISNFSNHSNKGNLPLTVASLFLFHSTLAVASIVLFQEIH